MLDRFKFWREKEAPINAIDLNGNKYFSIGGKIYREVEGALVEMPVQNIETNEGDGKAEFIGEGTQKEYEDMLKEENGTKGAFGT